MNAMTWGRFGPGVPQGGVSESVSFEHTHTSEQDRAGKEVAL